MIGGTEKVRQGRRVGALLGGGHQGLMDKIVSAGTGRQGGHMHNGRGLPAQQVKRCWSGRGTDGVGCRKARLKPLHRTRTARNVCLETATFSWLRNIPLQGLTVIYLTSPLLLVIEVVSIFRTVFRQSGKLMYL